MSATELAATSRGGAHRTAWIALLLWGVLHMVGGLVLVAAGSGTADEAVEGYASGLDAVALSGPGVDAVPAIVGFHGFNIAAAGVAVAVLAWRSRTALARAFDAGVLVALVADVGLVAFFLVPGVMAAADGAPGIVLLVVALTAGLASGWRPASLPG